MLLSMPARKLSSLPCPVGTKPTSLWQKSSRSACQRIPPLLATKPMIALPSDRQRPLRGLKPAFLVALTAPQTVPFSAKLYRRRHRIENFFQKIKRYRRVATRYDKLAETFLGFICFAILLTLRLT